MQENNIENETAAAETEAALPAEEIRPRAAAESTYGTPAGKGMSAMAKGLFVLFVVLLAGVGLLFWKGKIGGGGHTEAGVLTHVTKQDMEVLLKDENPMALKQIADNPDAKKKIAENIRQLLAVASQARKEGFADRPEVKSDLDDVQTVITAQMYDKQKNKASDGQMPPFGFITADQVKAYYDQPGNDEKFKSFINAKIEQAKTDGRLPADKNPTDEDLAQDKEFYAKTRIYEEEAKTEAPKFGDEYQRKVNLQIALQQAQLLARLYAKEVLTKKTEVTDEDVQNYLKQHPDLDNSTEKKAKADEVLKRAQAGEDFTKLAKETSEDPGSKDKGGLYEGVTKGQFVPEFEAAALALEPGQIAPAPIKSKFGYHIIKLEKKGTKKGPDGKDVDTYDVRHILISTTTQDPTNPMSPPQSAEDKVKAQLEDDKQKQALDEIVANNPVEVAEDFDIPQPSAEDLQKMQMQQQMRQQQMMPPGAGADSMPPPVKDAKKPEPKKGK